MSVLREYLAIFITLLSHSPTCALNTELTADNEMEGREKLSSISDSLKVLQDGRTGRVPLVKKLDVQINFANFNFVVRPKPQKFVDRENIPSYMV